MSKKRILVAVLNWGLGHATRSLPLITAFLEEGFEVILGSDGEALELLRKEFPELAWMSLPSYQITYPSCGKGMRWHFLKNSFKIASAVLAEQLLIKKLCREEKIDGILSDNRLGVYSNRIPTVYLTHQLKVPSGFSTYLTTRLHAIFINKFSECWVPDQKGERAISGKLGHSKWVKRPIHHLGIQSRLRKKASEKKYDLLVLLSGPEPQRQILEEQLLKELESYRGEAILIRGKVEGETKKSREGSLLVYNYLPAIQLETVINASELVLARSGYSTILDLAVLEKKAFFIPTPGQYEQEYLAQRMKELKIAPFSTQKDFTLEKIQEVAFFSGFRGFRSGNSPAGRFALFKGE